MLRINFTFMLLSYFIFNINSELCTYNSKKKYSDLIIKYPELTEQFNVMSQYPIPIWYTDRNSNSLNEIKDTLQNCQQSTSIIIIYGMVNKDCEAGESTAGSNKNSNDYVNFITNLHKEVNDRNIIYIVEPDALALSVNNKCGIKNNYIDNIKNALKILSQNKNAEIYLDIGHWVLIYGDQQIKDIINIINNIDPNKKIKGFSLNLSNYRSNLEMINACKKLRDMSNVPYKCIIDTSRNANGPDDKNTWCNLKSAGIGNLPTKTTNNELIDYFMWLKPAIEVDGHCYGSENSFQSSQSAGGNDIEFFKLLWNNGILKNNQNNNDNNKNNNDNNKNNNDNNKNNIVNNQNNIVNNQSNIVNNKNNEFSDDDLIKNNPFNSMESQCKSDDNICKDNVNKRRDVVNKRKNIYNNENNKKKSLRCDE